jgi:hypothetical protein
MNKTGNREQDNKLSEALTVNNDQAAGVKGGSRRADNDINIGVGELQECTISKAMD